MAGNRTSTIHRLHQVYGDVVRIGPKEVSFSSARVIKELYGQASTFLKAPSYDDFSLHPVGIFSMRNKNDHKQRRKLLSPAFAQSNLLETEPLIVTVVKRFLKRVESKVGHPQDVLALFRMLALDIVGGFENSRLRFIANPYEGELFLGKSFGALDSDEPPAYIEDIDRYFLAMGMKSSFPWVFKLVSYFPSKRWQFMLEAPHRLIEYGHAAFGEYVAAHGRDPRFSKHEEISTEIGNLVFAGTDTTSTTLTYLFWRLGQSEWQQRLRAELAPVKLLDGVAAFQHLTEYKILDAVIAETLRLHPPAPASLQRETPVGGRELGGYFIPAGTVVSMQCYTTQRNPDVFPNPEIFDPARWLATPERIDEMNILQMPFSRGTRACLGKNLAMMELKLVVVSVVKKFSITVANSTKSSDMRMKDHFLASPAGGRCSLIFDKLVHSSTDDG
ncbi:hypothetical protein LTR50_006245 [Elasticomyces elasticus]|nr:hypothetical protein LTR50_006245 [Elasticomyces elasticus]